MNDLHVPPLAAIFLHDLWSNRYQFSTFQSSTCRSAIVQYICIHYMTMSFLSFHSCRPEGQKLRTRRLSAPPGGHKPKPWPAGLWHHLPVRDPPPQVYHRGSLFGTVRGGASHYTVHPEWPDYYNSTFNSDVVH